MKTWGSIWLWSCCEISAGSLLLLCFRSRFYRTLAATTERNNPPDCNLYVLGSLALGCVRWGGPGRQRTWGQAEQRQGLKSLQNNGLSTHSIVFPPVSAGYKIYDLTLTPAETQLAAGERLVLSCTAVTELNVGIEFNWTHYGQALVSTRPLWSFFFFFTHILLSRNSSSVKTCYIL